MRAAVHVDRSVGVRPADVEDVDALQIGELDELDAVRRQELAEHAGGLASRVRLELVLLAVVEDGFRPRLKGCVLEPQRIGCDARGSHTPFSSGVLPSSTWPLAARGVGVGGPVSRPRPSATLPPRRPASFGHADLNARIRRCGCCWPRSGMTSAGERNTADAASITNSISHRVGQGTVTVVRSTDWYAPSIRSCA